MKTLSDERRFTDIFIAIPENNAIKTVPLDLSQMCARYCERNEQKRANCLQYFMELLQFQIRQPDLCSSQPVLNHITYCAKVAFAKLNAPSGDTYTPDR